MSKVIEGYLDKRGYVMKYISGNTIWIKGFTYVMLNSNQIHVWHNPKKPIIINNSFFENLNITLDYMEKI